MTRTELLNHVGQVDGAARARGLRARAEIAEPAAEAELDVCEASLGARLPDNYRATLAEWNGALIEVYEPESPGSGEEVLNAQFAILGTKQIAATSRVLREILAEAMAGSSVSAAVEASASQLAAIVSHDDIYVLINCSRAASDTAVRFVDLAYALSQFPPEMRIIASSPDDYLAKSLAHLAKTLERETYWW